jgi:hypothetical protein
MRNKKTRIKAMPDFNRTLNKDFDREKEKKLQIASYGEVIYVLKAGQKVISFLRFKNDDEIKSTEKKRKN